MNISPGVKRALAITFVGVPAAGAAALALPLTALPLDSRIDSGWLFPISFGAAAGVGALAGFAAPVMFGQGRTRLAGAAIGAGVGLGVTLAADAALFLGLTDR